MTFLRMKDGTSSHNGFTLVELIIVLMIISALVTIVVPYANRSNETLKMEQKCLDISEAIKYAIDLAVNTRRPTRIVINHKENSYLLEIAEGTSNQGYNPIEDSRGTIRYFGKNVHVIDMTGFSVAGNGYYLTFDPTKPWPIASISFSSRDVIKTVKIRGKHVEIEAPTI